MTFYLKDSIMQIYSCINNIFTNKLYMWAFKGNHVTFFLRSELTRDLRVFLFYLVGLLWAAVSKCKNPTFLSCSHFWPLYLSFLNHGLLKPLSNTVKVCCKLYAIYMCYIFIMTIYSLQNLSAISHLISPMLHRLTLSENRFLAQGLGN